MTDAPVHWLRGGSASDRIYACPGYPNVAAMYPPEPSGEAAIDGTHSHTYLAYCLESQIWDASTLIGEKMADHEGEFIIEADRAERVQVALDYVKSRVESLPNCKVIVEDFVDAGEQFGIPQWGGSVDITLIWDTGYEIIDFKDGYKAVDPKTKQTVTYGGGVRAKYNLHHLPIRRTIVQPKRFRQPQWVEESAVQFSGTLGDLANVMQQSRSPSAPRRPGDHCKYCVGAQPGRCHEFNHQTRSVMNDIVTNNTPIGAPGPLQIAEIGANTPDEQLIQMLDMAPLIKQMLIEAEKEAIRRASNGTVFPGRKLVRSTASEKWVDNAEEELNRMRVPKSVIYKEVPRTPKQVYTDDWFKDLGKRKQANIMGLIYRPEGSLKLVLESEPGKPVELGVSKEALAEAVTTATDIAPKPVENPPVPETKLKYQF